jgi:hypothetical protein
VRACLELANITIKVAACGILERGDCRHSAIGKKVSVLFGPLKLSFVTLTDKGQIFKEHRVVVEATGTDDLRAGHVPLLMPPPCS